MALDLLDNVTDPELVALDVETTLADQIAFNRYIWTNPAWRQQQGKMLILSATIAPIVILALSFAIVWAVPSSYDINTALGTDSRELFFAKILASVLLAAAGVAYAYTWTYTKRFDETAKHLFIIAEPMFGFIPKRDLPADTLLTIRAVAKQVHEP